MMQILVGVGLGAALAYFLDPRMGNGRRIRLRDRAMARFRRGAAGAEGIGRDAANRAYGMAHEATDAVRSAAPVGAAR
jgi:hypothetical protein